LQSLIAMLNEEYGFEMRAERLGDRMIVGRSNVQPDQVFCQADASARAM